MVHVHQQPSPAPTVVISSAFGLSCTEPRYLMTLLARRLADGGANVVQYDQPGAGDSTGDSRTLSSADLFRAGCRVLDYSAGMSSGRIALVGYGVGNAVVSWLMEHHDLDAAVLIAPCMRAWGRDWTRLCGPGSDGFVAPQVTPDDSELGDVWRALYGEPVVPSQPPGPIGSRLFVDLAALRPYQTICSRHDDVLVISDIAADLDGATSVLLAHKGDSTEPSWHWGIGPRGQVVEGVADWVERTRPGPFNDLSASTCSRTHATGIVRLRTDTSGSKSSTMAIRVHGDVMFGVLRRPAVSSPLPGLCVVYETGNPGQRVDIHGCGPVIAERLAGHGLASFRYDPRGMGLSTGRFQDMTWSRRVEDLSAVIEALKAEHFESIVVLGNSAGARVGLRGAALERCIVGLVLWGPILRETVIEGPPPKVLRVDGGVATEWCGLPLGLRYQRDVRDHDDIEVLVQSDTPICLVFAEDEPDRLNEQLVLAAAASRAGVTVCSSPGQHGFSWSGLQEAIEHSLRWIEASVGTRVRHDVRGPETETGRMHSGRSSR